MALIDNLKALQRRTLSELDASHDYYFESNIAWRIVKLVIDGGYDFSFANPTTQSLITASGLLAKMDDYTDHQLTQSTFTNFVSIFETWFFDFFRTWLMTYPQSLGAKSVPLSVVLDSPDKETILLSFVNKELNEIAYEKPEQWFKALEEKTKFGLKLNDQIAQITEVKASRDVLIHNRGVVNRIYLMKAAKLARFIEGERMEITHVYHRETWQLFRGVVEAITEAAERKLIAP